MPHILTCNFKLHSAICVAKCKSVNKIRLRLDCADARKIFYMLTLFSET